VSHALEAAVLVSKGNVSLNIEEEDLAGSLSGRRKKGRPKGGGCQKQKGPRKQPRDMQPCMLSPWLICGVMLGEGVACSQRRRRETSEPWC
jgi:hypothetical protein